MRDADKFHKKFTWHNTTMHIEGERKKYVCLLLRNEIIRVGRGHSIIDDYFQYIIIIQTTTHSNNYFFNVHIDIQTKVSGMYIDSREIRIQKWMIIHKNIIKVEFSFINLFHILSPLPHHIQNSFHLYWINAKSRGVWRFFRISQREERNQ
jgi:hypothetical protein